MTRGRKNTKEFMNYNGRLYKRSTSMLSTKEEAIRYKKELHKDGHNAVIDKRKAGYFLWIGTNPRIIKRKK